MTCGEIRAVCCKDHSIFLEMVSYRPQSSPATIAETTWTTLKYPKVGELGGAGLRGTLELFGECLRSKGTTTDPSKVSGGVLVLQQHFVVLAWLHQWSRLTCTDEVSGRHNLSAAFAKYVGHYNGQQPHQARELHPPRPSHPAANLSHERIKHRSVLDGLINEYERAA